MAALNAVAGNITGTLRAWRFFARIVSGRQVTLASPKYSAPVLIKRVYIDHRSASGSDPSTAWALMYATDDGDAGILTTATPKLPSGNLLWDDSDASVDATTADWPGFPKMPNAQTHPHGEMLLDYVVRPDPVIIKFTAFQATAATHEVSGLVTLYEAVDLSQLAKLLG